MQIFKGLSWGAFLLCFCVVVFGAFVRLSDAGLGCPDWPTCYGQATWPTQADEVNLANEAFPERPVETHKAWREQVHRHLAATLGILVLALASFAARDRRWGLAIVLGSAATVVLAVVLHILKVQPWDTLLVVAAELLLIVFALTAPARHLSRMLVLTLAVVIFQAILGMWTVTLLLKPIVVTGHLLGGLLTLSLLMWNVLDQSARKAVLVPIPRGLPSFAVLGLLLLAVQIFLGGWTSTNYAALVCPDFPTCQGRWLPDTNFSEAYQLWRGLGVDYEFGVLNNRERVTIHFIHRVGALTVTVVLLGLAVALLFAARQYTMWRGYAIALTLALTVQIAIGVSIIELQLPLGLATAHNAGAALLLLVMLALNHRLQAIPAGDSV